MDLDNQADEVWLHNVQHKLYQWSRTTPIGCYRDLWNWIETHNLRCAWRGSLSVDGDAPPQLMG
jgi:hypothetical protein